MFALRAVIRIAVARDERDVSDAEPFGAWDTAGAQRAVWPRELTHDRHLQTVAREIPDDLRPGSLPLMVASRGQIAALDLRNQFPALQPLQDSLVFEGTD